jgi:8-amino-7-oxononanoate synthase
VKNFRDRVMQELDDLDDKGLRRRARQVEGPQTDRLWVDGREVLCLCSNNYLGFARHPALLAALRDALDAEGLGASGSRQISGNMNMHRQAEAQLARFAGQPASCLFSTGYAANVGVLQALANQEDVIFSDRLNHASLIDGARLSRARVVIFEHADPDDLRRKLVEHRSQGSGALVVTETLFSMDGDIAPMLEIAELAREFEAGLVVDEAHALGVLGPAGRGVCAELSIVPDVLIGMLGKAFGSHGAFAAGAGPVVDLIRNRARSYVFSTAPSPAIAATAIAAVRLVERADGPRATLRDNWRQLRGGLRELGYKVLGDDSPIVPILVGDSRRTMELSNALFERGVFVHGVRPPTVPVGGGRLRAVPMASHSAEQIAEALTAFAEVRS